MSEATYKLERAKSSRAKCRACKETIEKGALKIVIEGPPRTGQDFSMSYSHHVRCFKMPRKLVSVTVEEFVEDYLMGGGDEKDGTLLEDHKDEVIRFLTEAAEKKKVVGRKSSGGKEEDENIMARLRAAFDAAAAREIEPVKKKAKKEVKADGEEAIAHSDNHDEIEAMLPIYEDYHMKKADELKDVLRWNKQILKGTKDFVLFKVLDGTLHGRVAFCPLCEGALKIDENDWNKIVCRGRYDEDIGQTISCNYSAPRAGPKAAPRLLPFFLEEPTEEESKALEEEKKAVRGELDGPEQFDRNPLAQELLTKAQEMTIYWNTKDGIKAAAKEFAELVKGKVDVPEQRDTTMEIGKILVNNRDKSPKEIMMEIVVQYGFADIKADKKAAREAAVEASCANPKNAALIMALKECGGYYFKEGNRNAGSSYTKAVQTLTDLEEEVTAENAMSFSKGKTKLPGIGKGTAEKMKEFCETGTFAKLEEKRAAHEG